MIAMQVMQVCCDVAVDVAVRENAARPVDLGNVICMSDVSGSMSGTPMEVPFGCKSELTACIFCTAVVNDHLQLTYNIDVNWFSLVSV